jgi:hypothetical protein
MRIVAEPCPKCLKGGMVGVHNFLGKGNKVVGVRFRIWGTRIGIGNLTVWLVGNLAVLEAVEKPRRSWRR